MDMIKVENESLVRDKLTGAILETDALKLKKHRARRSLVEHKDNVIYSLTERINKLEQLIERMVQTYD